MAAALVVTAAVTIVGSSSSAAPSTAVPAYGVRVPHRLADLEMVRGSGQVLPSEARTARCPQGKQPLGGGFELPEGHSVAASFPIADSGWQVRARSDTGDTAPFDMTWYAMCATPSPGYRVVKLTATVPNQQGVGGLTCSTISAPYEYMANVGADAKGPTAALISNDMWTNPSSAITYASASGARSDADAVEIDLYAICIKVFDGSTDWYGQAWSSHPNGDGPTWTCPAGKSSVGVTFNGNGYLTSSEPHATSSGNWRLTGVNPSGPDYGIKGGIVCAPLNTSPWF
ncbi:hypothetical protein AGRA3207_003207 [Actinomadura graeca]|uniref:Secreted protein n=1 Tax=Actinomadura graeca TaxID=2750812 RepID=A0ABX8QWY0_9ACTN|nr:hypothetical protein [Actinomadura graeca]QXJ22237.1 hypothetical protein AGRA3207_003207 [Actinomadura graeca]